MNISLEQLRTLHAAAIAGSFSGAARRLGKAQSVVSTTIANLEIDLGLALFDRTGHTPKLTLAGERVLQEARSILGMCEHLQALAGELAAGVEPQVTLAVDDDSQLPWLSPVLEAFSAQFPDVELELLFPMLEDLSDMLLSGRAHLGISYQPLHRIREISAQPLAHVPLRLAVAPTHPLAHGGPVTLADLQQSRQLLVTNRLSGEERQRFRLAAKVWWIEGDLGVLEMVKRGLGWATIPDYLLAEPLQQGDVVLLQSDYTAIAPVLTLELLCHQNRALGLAGRWLKEALVQHWRQET